MDEPIRCSKCGEDRAPTDFYYSKGKRNPWCKACYRAWYRATREDRIRFAQASKEAKFGPWITVPCEQCGTVIRQRDHGTRRRRFCSLACGDRGHKDAVSAALHAAKPDRWCAWCGRELERTKRSDAYYCDERCMNAAHGLMLNIRRRGGIRTPAGSRISRADLMATSGGVCGICRGAVDPELAWPEPMSASVDHIVPIARGGAVDDPANMQIAHLTCNVKKRAREGWVPA